MSFLLGGRKKRRGMAPPPQGGNRPSFRFDTSGNRGGGGRQGMVMLQRKPTITQIHEATDLQQKSVQPVTPQQHSQGVISMKEGKMSTVIAPTRTICTGLYDSNCA